MIVIDTNVVSETMRPVPNRTVVRWLDAQAAETLFLSAVSLGELLFGIAILPEGRRKAELTRSLRHLVARTFEGRVLPYDARAAEAYASVVARARAVGRPVGVADAQIAAIAVQNAFRVATRDAAPFEAAGLEVLNPWAAR